MGLLVSIVERRAVEVEVSGHHRLGRTVGDRVPVNIDSRERQRRRYLVGHCFDVVRWNEATAAR
jgi:hypothetical protein